MPYLKALRDARDLTQCELATAVGLDQKFISDLEKGRRGKCPSFRVVIALADFFAIDPRTLQFGPAPDAGPIATPTEPT